MTVKAKDIEQAICNHFWRGMLWFPQLRVGTGFGHDAERTMDLFGIQPLSPWDRICVEIKVSRGDFRRDIRQPMKQRRARLLANQFFYAAPKGLLTAEDLPTWAGLIEVDAARKYGEFGFIEVPVPAPRFDSAAPSWRFLAVFARMAAKQGKDGAA
jgi:hypothetical protein